MTIPSPTELVEAEQDAWIITEAYRRGKKSYLESANALRKAREYREQILEEYRLGNLKVQ